MSQPTKPIKFTCSVCRKLHLFRSQVTFCCNEEKQHLRDAYYLDINQTFPVLTPQEEVKAKFAGMLEIDY